MKPLKLFISSLLFLQGFTGTMMVSGCNLSSFTLVSFNVTGSGPSAVYTITTQLCVGYGRTGVVFGGDGPTGYYIDFAVYGDISLFSAFTSATPTLTGPPLPGTTLGFAGNVGPGFGVGEVDNLLYDDFGCGCSEYACISSTAACGNAGSWCQNIVFTYTGIYPDSLKALGIEGPAPFGGCWPNADMLIDLTAVLPVVWGDFEGIAEPGGISLTWSTHSEANTDKYIITRAGSQQSTFDEIGELQAAGTSMQINHYDFYDAHPLPGKNVYRIHQIDDDGGINLSDFLQVYYLGPSHISLKSVFPNPSPDLITIEVASGFEETAKITVFDISGKERAIRYAQLEPGTNQIQLNLNDLPSGIYLMRISAGGDFIEEKIVRL